VQKVTIIPRGQAGGYTLFLPDDDSLSLRSVSQFKARLAVSLGGRLAEEIAFGTEEVTTGASGDLVTVTRTARSMVTRYGMSRKLGPMVFGEKEELIFLGREISEQRNYSDAIAHLIDTEVQAIVNEAYENAQHILIENRAVLDDMANALIEYETIDGEQLAEFVKRVKSLTIELNTLPAAAAEAVMPGDDTQPQTA